MTSGAAGGLPGNRSKLDRYTEVTVSGRIGVPNGRCVSASSPQLSENPLEPMVLAVLDRESGCLPCVGQLVRARCSVGTLSCFSRAMSRCRLSRLWFGGITPPSRTTSSRTPILPGGDLSRRLRELQGLHARRALFRFRLE
eukprot:scaffold16230_cov63-Phaeocystis_antarctica.AAC.4